MTSDITHIDQIWTGKDLGVRDFVVDEELVDKYTETLGLPNRTVGEAGPAPPIALTDAEDGFEGNHFANRFGELWVRQEWHFSRELRLGQRFAVTARIEDVYQRRDRTVVATEHLISGETTGRSRPKASTTTASCLDKPTERRNYPIPTVEGPVPGIRSPAVSQSVREDRVITPEMCGRFYRTRLQLPHRSLRRPGPRVFRSGDRRGYDDGLPVGPDDGAIWQRDGSKEAVWT